MTRPAYILEAPKPIRIARRKRLRTKEAVRLFRKRGYTGELLRVIYSHPQGLAVEAWLATSTGGTFEIDTLGRTRKLEALGGVYILDQLATCGADPR